MPGIAPSLCGLLLRWQETIAFSRLDERRVETVTFRMNSWVQTRLTSLQSAFDEAYCASIEKASQAIIQAFRSGKTLLLCGNGGSAADAQHIAAEFVGRFLYDRPPLKAISLTANTSVLTAWANDYEYETVFSRQVEAHGGEGDVLWGITTSGKSKNVLEAARVARQRKMVVIGMAGNGGGPLSELSDIPLVISEKATPRIQEAQLITYHRICEQVEAALFPR